MVELAPISTSSFDYQASDLWELLVAVRSRKSRTVAEAFTAEDSTGLDHDTVRLEWCRGR